MMNEELARRRAIRVLAILCGACSLAVVVLSSYLRLAAAGLGCADWPACYGAQLVESVQPLSYGLPRLLHRIVASLDLVLACLLVWRCRKPYPIQPVARQAGRLLALILFLAALGFFSSDPRRAFVSFLNIVGGLALVVLSWRVVAASVLISPEPEGGGHVQSVSRRAIGVALAVLGLAVVLGAWVGATYSAVACLSLPVCDGVWWPGVGGWSALNPSMTLASAAPAGDPGGVGLNLLHRGFALLASVSIGGLAFYGLRREPVRRTAILVLLFLTLVVGSGGSAVKSGLDLWLVVAHGTAAALLLTAVSAMVSRYRVVR